MNISSFFSSTANTSGNIPADIYAKVSKIMQAQNTAAPKLNAALTVDKTTLSGLGQLQSALATFQGVAQSISGKGLNLVASSLSQNVTSFVNAYNALNTKLSALQQGELQADGSALNTQSQLAHILVSTSSGSTSASSLTLAKIGITANKNGALTLDATQLNNAITADPAGVAQLFTNGGKGVADNLTSQIQTIVGPSGSLPKKETALTKDIASLNTQKASLEKKLTAQTSALVKLYSQQSGSSTTPVGLSHNRSSIFDFWKS